MAALLPMDVGMCSSRNGKTLFYVVDVWEIGSLGGTRDMENMTHARLEVNPFTFWWHRRKLECRFARNHHTTISGSTINSSRLFLSTKASVVVVFKMEERGWRGECHTVSTKEIALVVLQISSAIRMVEPIINQYTIYGAEGGASCPRD